MWANEEASLQPEFDQREIVELGQFCACVRVTMLGASNPVTRNKSFSARAGLTTRAYG